MATAAHYARIAEAYWRTYLPSRVAGISDPTSFFARMGQQVLDETHAGADATPPPRTSSSSALIAARQGAMQAAEELALREIVYLTPEPGTETRRLPGLVLPGEEPAAQ